ncbi:aminoglycoside phosphotransferase family protein [Aliikangiella sp. IMCC44359]|uniref:aminoglycoside phosphotransferase family protein n=1 Tax=Aliikangiella sp. IMCC44359 TaxID=3459125 RepID=UPI00403AAEEB
MSQISKLTLLPEQPTYEQAVEIIDQFEDSFWLPVLEYIKDKHHLPTLKFERITEGANVLFQQSDSIVIKIVPPNWIRQGSAELEAANLLTNKLTLATPKVLAHGKINNWLYIIITKLPGISLADVWPSMNIDNKRDIVNQLGEFIRYLHLIPMENNSSLKVEWNNYLGQLKQDCIARHTRKKVPSQLVEQITPYLATTNSKHDDGDVFFIHMDLHPWNIMVEKQTEHYRITGIIDFGDAIIGRSRLLELATPILFLCQGDKGLIDELISSYQLLNNYDANALQKDLMSISLLRPACDFNFVLKQVPITGARETWEQIAEQLFPI